MAIKVELEEYVSATHSNEWARRAGEKVPEASDLKLSNDAAEIEGTVLYADLAESTGLVSGYKDWFAAEVYKNYLYCAARIIRLRNGTITAYDGDRVMAVFIGDSKNSDAAKCALQINWTVRNILRPAIKKQYPSSEFSLNQRVGIDSSNLLVARTGIRGSNDLVWVGNAANNAAKMATLPTGYPSYISANVYDRLNEKSKFGGDPKEDMWNDLGTGDLGYRIYGSTFWWSL